MKYSLKQGILKAVKYAIFFLVAGLISGLPPEIKQLTIGGILVLLFNYLKVRWQIKIPLLDK